MAPEYLQPNDCPTAEFLKRNIISLRMNRIQVIINDEVITFVRKTCPPNTIITEEMKNWKISTLYTSNLQLEWNETNVFVQYGDTELNEISLNDISEIIFNYLKEGYQVVYI